jgi:striatin 1/3/4
VIGRQINCVVAHPTLPLTITAHEDRHIRFFDNTTGKLVHSMVAHLDSVTSLAVDPNGLYLLSGSEYYCQTNFCAFCGIIAVIS